MMGAALLGQLPTPETVPGDRNTVAQRTSNDMGDAPPGGSRRGVWLVVPTFWSPPVIRLRMPGNRAALDSLAYAIVASQETRGC
jgi:hypothetical protein